MKTITIRLFTLCAVLAGCGGEPEVTTHPSDGIASGGSSTAADAGDAMTARGAGGKGLFDDDAGLGQSNDRGQDAGEKCLIDTAEAERTPLDIALLVDSSYSMDFALRWEYVRGALLSFVGNPQFTDTAIALQFFPLREQCDVPTYRVPAVSMESLGDAKLEIEAVVSERRMSGGTPVVQALQGLGDYLLGWAGSHPERKPIVVLATDGVPDATCSGSSFDPPNSLEGAADVAKGLALGEPPVPVFVIGVGEELSSLHRIAEAGGTGRAVLIEDGASAQREFLETLETIRRQTLSCSFRIPELNDGTDLDYGNVNVQYSRGSGEPSTFFYVGAPEDCELASDAGWYYDSAEAPGEVILCPETCDRITAARAARIDIAYGCKRRDVAR